MSKKWFVLLAVLAALGVMAFGLIGSGAWFTDEAAIEGNSITTGSLDLRVWGGPFTVNKIEPEVNYQTLGFFCAQNNGDYDMKWRGWVDQVSDEKGLRDHLVVRAIINPPEAEGNYGPKNTELWANHPIAELMSPNTLIVMNDPDWPFTPGSFACYRLDVRLLRSAPNAVQNATLTGRLYLQATQRINVGWGEQDAP